MRALLPQDLASECRVANVRDRILTVHINNAAWATRLRFLIPQLLASLPRLTDFTAVNEIRLKVVTVADAARPVQSTDERRPPDAIPLLELAGAVDDADLREKLLRLAAHSAADRKTL